MSGAIVSAMSNCHSNALTQEKWEEERLSHSIVIAVYWVVGIFDFGQCTFDGSEKALSLWYTTRAQDRVIV